MSKLKFNSSVIDHNVIDNLTNAIKDLELAVSLSRNIKSSYSFSGVSQISNLSNNIEDIKSELNKVISWLNQSKQILDNVEDSIVSDFNNTHFEPITKITSIIK